MEVRRALELLGTFTAEQWGMVTSRQATGLDVDGVTLHRLEKAGYLDRVRRGVYAATTATATEAREEQAAWLTLNASEPAWKRPPLDPDGGVLSHQSAARLHGLGELVNDRITLVTPRRRTSRDPDLWFKTARLADEDVTVIDGLPVTTALRTICDLLNQHIDGSHIATIIRQAVEANLVQLDVLAEHIGPYALRYGVRRPGDGEALLDQLLAEIGTTTARLAHRPVPPRTAAATAGALWLVGYSNAMLKQLRETAGATLSPALSKQIQEAAAAMVFPPMLGMQEEAAGISVLRGIHVGETKKDTGVADDDPAHDDGGHGPATEHTQRLPRLPEEQSEEQVEGDRYPRR